MKQAYLFFILAIGLFPGISNAGTPCNEYEDCYKLFVPYVQGVSASRLDPALPDVPFGKWLAGYIKPGTEIRWEVNDCGEDSGFDDPEFGHDYVTCVGVEATLKNGSLLRAGIIAGTVNKGITGEPQIFDGADELEGLRGIPLDGPR